MSGRRPRLKSDFLDYLQRKRGKARTPVRELVFEIDQRLFFLARARVLFVRAMAQGLLLLTEADNLARLGYRNLGDYSVERLGMSRRQAQQLRTIAAALKNLPCVDEAWAGGDLKYCVVRFLAGNIPTIEDALWAEFGKGKTENEVRAEKRTWDTLKARGEVPEAWRRYVEEKSATPEPATATGESSNPAHPLHEAGSALDSEDADDERRGRWLQFRVPAHVATKWYVGLEIASRQAGHDVPASGLMEAAIPEFMTAKGFEALARVDAEKAAAEAVRGGAGEAGGGIARAAAAATCVAPSVVVGILCIAGGWAGRALHEGAWAEDAEPSPADEASQDDPKETEATWGKIEDDLAELNDHWAHLSWCVPHLRLPSQMEWPPEAPNPREIDRRLRALTGLSQRNDYHLMELLLDFSRAALYVDLEFTSLAHYVQERLGLSASWGNELVSLALALRRRPLVAKALREKRLHQVQARLVCRVARDPWDEAWIEHARSTTVRFLKEDVEAAERLRDRDLEAFDRTGGLPEARPVAPVPHSWQRGHTGSKKTGQADPTSDPAELSLTVRRFFEELAARLEESDQTLVGPGPDSCPPTGAPRRDLAGILSHIVTGSAGNAERPEGAAAGSGQRQFRVPATGAESSASSAGEQFRAPDTGAESSASSAGEQFRAPDTGAGSSASSAGEQFRAPDTGTESSASSAGEQFRAPDTGAESANQDPWGRATGGVPTGDGTPGRRLAKSVKRLLDRACGASAQTLGASIDLALQNYAAQAADVHRLALKVSRALRDPDELQQASPLVSDLTHLVDRFLGGSEAGKAPPTDVAPADLPFKERLKRVVRAYASGESTDEFWPQKNIRIRFWLPKDLEESWDEALRAHAAITGVAREAVNGAEFIEALLDSYLQEWARQALADVRRHPIIERGGWKCSVPTCTNRACLEEHHIRFRSHGGSNDRINLAPLCWFHHRQGIHSGRIVMEGAAPDGLLWRIGVDSEGEHMLVIGRLIVESVANAA